MESSAPYSKQSVSFSNPALCTHIVNQFTNNNNLATMHKFTLCLLCSMLLTAHLFAQTTQGFSTITDLTPMAIPRSTKDIQQAKVWNYAGKWWTVLPTYDGTKLLRLDGTTWTATLTVLAGSTNAKTDCRVVGNLVHVLLFRGDNLDSYLLSLEYDQASGNYKFWSQRPTLPALRFEPETETASLEIDSSGRMWIASDDSSRINVRWSDYPYSSWSTPYPIATGVKNLDICAISALPGKIGVIWSNQNTERFGFRTHANGTDPTLWTADEVPASQSANNLNDGMADDHINLAVSGNGTLYCAIKTGWNTNGMARIALLVRRPTGTWDSLYTVDAYAGNRPIVLLNETLGKLKVIYTSQDSGGDIIYRESSTSTIAFGTPIKLISTGHLYSYATSTHQNYNPEVVILATDESTSPLQLVGVLAKDETSAPPPPTDTTTNPAVVSFTLVNAATDQDVMTVQNGDTIDLYTLGLTQVNIRANTSPSSVGSVKFELGGTQNQTFTDSSFPYALHGDDGSGNYYYGNWNPPAPGSYTLKATPYGESNAGSTAGTPLTISFTFTNSSGPTNPTPTQRVTSFTLVNADTDKDVMTITDGAVINLNALGVTKATIRANTSPSTVGSVKFELSGTQTYASTDNKAPYALHGDRGAGNYLYGNWNPPPLGSYTLKATPYSSMKASGTAGAPLTIRFTFTSTMATTALATGPSGFAVSKEGSPQAKALVYPNPFAVSTTVNFTLPHSGQYTVTLHDATGRTVSLLKQGWAAAAVQNTVTVDGILLTGRFYFVRIQTAEGTQTLKLLHQK